MPKVVNHAVRRAQIARALRRVVGREGITAVSVRSVAREADLPPSSLRHYFTTQDELLTFAVDQLLDDATTRFAALDRTGPPRAVALRLLAETVPLDEQRRYEVDVWFAFAARAVANPQLRERRRHFDQLLRQAARAALELLDEAGELAAGLDREVETDRLHALIDGLALHGSSGAGLLDPARIVAVFGAHLDQLAGAGVA